MASRSSTLRSTELDLDTADDITDLLCTAMSASSPMLVCIPLCAVSSHVLTLHTVVRTPEDAAHSSKQPFDYVLLCVKALPDVYDIANIIESVVAPQHTCILMNTTHSIGVESYLEQRFPTNVVLSLVSGAEIVQLGASEFEHKGATDIWVGPANKNAAIPAQIQSDMAEALSMTLSSGQVDCQVSPNIRQQQYERMIGFVLLLFSMLS
jgi:ketopantoate reductase